jgi:hypothetical protein
MKKVLLFVCRGLVIALLCVSGFGCMVTLTPRGAAVQPVTDTQEGGLVEWSTQRSHRRALLRSERLSRDYPQYYENIIRQIQRCFRWRDGGNWETVLFFNIDREGNALDIQFVTRSGSTGFDYESMGAVDCAGQAGRFGALPEDLPYERFPVRFRFRPSGDSEAFFPTAGTPGEVTFER